MVAGAALVLRADAPRRPPVTACQPEEGGAEVRYRDFGRTALIITRPCQDAPHQPYVVLASYISLVDADYYTRKESAQAIVFSSACFASWLFACRLRDRFPATRKLLRSCSATPTTSLIPERSKKPGPKPAAAPATSRCCRAWATPSDRIRTTVRPRPRRSGWWRKPSSRSPRSSPPRPSGRLLPAGPRHSKPRHRPCRPWHPHPQLHDDPPCRTEAAPPHRQHVRAQPSAHEAHAPGLGKRHGLRRRTAALGKLRAP